jgi:hypothetical protein
MKYVVDDRLSLSRQPKGPLADYIVPFAGSLGSRGYSLVSLRNQVLIATGFSDWLEQEGIALSCLSAEHPERYLLHRARHRRPKRGDHAALRHLIEFLHGLDVIPEAAKAECKPSEVEQYLLDYEGYLRDARARSSQTRHRRAIAVGLPKARTQSRGLRTPLTEQLDLTIVARLAHRSLPTAEHCPKESRNAQIENLEGSVRSRSREDAASGCDATSLKPD